MEQYSKYLSGGEELWYVYRQHLAPYFLKLLIGVLIILTDFFFLWPLFQKGIWGVGLFIFGIACGAFLLIKTGLRWRKTILLITNNRFLDVHREGIWYETVSQIAHNSVVDVSWFRKGLGATVFRYGTVLIQGASNVRLSFAHMKSPSALADLVVAICRQEKGVRIKN